MFDIENPANSLVELVNFLKQDQEVKYVYRGQVSDYGKLLPSIFRNAISSELDGFNIYAPKEDASRIQILKASIQYFFFMETFGSLLGNYLGQQYLGQSACIDVTEDIDVAAFFSKMLYPNYNKMYINDEKLGVIYRFDKGSFSSNIIPKPQPIVNPAINRETTEFVTHEIIVDEFKTTDYELKLNFDNALKHYIIHDTLTTYSDMEPVLKYYQENYTDRLLKYDFPTNYFARPKAQKGGLIQPKYICQYHKDDDRKRHFGDAVGVEDIYGKYSMEKFYFRHSPTSLKLSREDIWPSIYIDPLLAQIGWHVANLKDDLKIELEIKIKQIIDFGFEDNIPQEILDM